MAIYINGSSCISAQRSFDGNYNEPEEYFSSVLNCIEPDYKAYFDTKLMRRMGRLVKMGMATALEACKKAGNPDIDGIISGTGMGCVDDTGTFLNRMSDPANRMMNPTAFINSTHNTVGSLVAIHLGNKGYNATYSHLDVSFENALQDAVLSLKHSQEKNFLLGAFDELTPDLIYIYNQLNYLRKQEVSNLKLSCEKLRGTIVGEGCAFFVVSSEKTDCTVAELQELKILYKPSKAILEQTIEELKTNNRNSIILSGRNGDKIYDAFYISFEEYFKDSIIYHYKKLCGSYPVASSFAFWLALEALSGKLSLFQPLQITACNDLIIYNTNQDYHSFIRLKKC